MDIIFLCIILALSLFQPIFAKWSTPLNISSKEYTSTHPTMYTDSGSSASHVLWIEDINIEDRLMYSRVFTNKTFTAPIAIEPALSVVHYSIIGEGNGQHLLVTYAASRRYSRCDEVDKKGCHQIYFTESFNGGNSWSKPIPMSHNASSTLIDSKFPEIIYISQTKQTYIAFIRYNHEKSYVAYTTRNNTENFTSEEILPLTYDAEEVFITYTVDSKTKIPKIHMAYVNENHDIWTLIYTSSLDNGKSWKSPKELLNQRSESAKDILFRCSFVANSTMLGDSIFLAFAYMYKAHLMWSIDDGNTWSKVMPLSPEKSQPPKLQLCKDPDESSYKIHYIYTLDSTSTANRFIFGTLDPHKGPNKNGDSPFTKISPSWGYGIGCFVDDYYDDEVVMVSAGIYGSTQLSIVTSYNNRVSATDSKMSYAD